jgi:histidinol-phosphate aminotransferase
MFPLFIHYLCHRSSFVAFTLVSHYYDAMKTASNVLLDAMQPQLQDLAPYQPGMPIEELARRFGVEPGAITKLASNENPHGMSPGAAKAAAQAATADGARYPDPYTLRVALAHHWQVPENSLVLGNGSNDVLDIIARVFLGSNTNAVSSQYAFAMYRLVTKSVGAANVVVPAQEYGHDLAAMHAAITPQTRVVWLANPNNPTGTFVKYDAVEKCIAAVPRNVAVVLDEAYYEYLPENLRVDTTSWLQAYPNLILVRTFSKVYGLAGLRVGYGMAAAPVAEMLNRVRQPFNVNQAAIAAAVASLQDQDYVAASRQRNELALQQLTQGLKALGLDYLPTYGNFVTVKFANASAVNQALLKQGIIVRPVA